MTRLDMRVGPMDQTSFSRRRPDQGRPSRYLLPLADRPLAQVIDQLETRYHRRYWTSLGRIEALARRVHEVYGAADPIALSWLADAVIRLRADLEKHMWKEERLLFPWIRSGDGGTARSAVRTSEGEHAAIAGHLEQIRELTHEYREPPEGNVTWRGLVGALAALDDSLGQYLRIEREVLFPRALMG